MTRTTLSCPSPRDLERAFDDTPSAALRDHLDACPTCAARWSELEELSRLVELAMPVPPLAPDRSACLREGILARATVAPSDGPVPGATRPWTAPRLVAALAAAAVVFGIGGALLLGGDAQQMPAPRAGLRYEYKGTVGAHPGARWVRLGALPDEAVRLLQGTLTVEVEALARGERFRVITGDAEVEVRGTAFDVTAEDDHLTAVRVHHGIVEVRVGAAPPVLLRASERWTASPRSGERARVAGRGAEPELPAKATPQRTVTPESPPTPAAPRPAPAASREETAPAATAPPKSATPEVAPPHAHPAPRAKKPHRPQAVRAVRQAPPDEAEPAADAAARAGAAGVPAAETEPAGHTPPSPDEVAGRRYQEAWASLREADFGRAAERFAQVVRVAPGSALAAEAGYWLGVSLGRAGRKGEAARALQRFLDAHPGSGHRDEASVMLGWILVQRGERDRARRLFQAALASPVEAVRTGARRGLDALSPAAGARRP